MGHHYHVSLQLKFQLDSPVIEVLGWITEGQGCQVEISVGVRHGNDVNSYPILPQQELPYTLGVNFRGWCLMKAVATLRKQLNNEKVRDTEQ